jgi:hypothetical protein
MLAEVLSHPLHCWDNGSRLEKVSRCNMLIEKVSVAFSVLMITFVPGMWRMND